MYPKLEINIKKIEQNALKAVNMCKEQGIDVAIVTKLTLADSKVVDSFLKAKPKYLADSRIKNLEKLGDINIEKMLIRMPMASEIEKVVKYSQVSLNSELETIKLINEECKKQNKTHKVILMVDLGDLREGFFKKEELFSCIKEVINLPNIILEGIGVNLTCVGGVIPEEATMEKLVSIAREIEEAFNIKLNTISGGNSSTFTLLLEGKSLKGITNLRLGEAILMGRETSYQNFIEGFNHDNFILKAQIIELKEKPSVPIGKIGKDAFDNIPVFKDKGEIKKAILAVGRQDIVWDNMVALDEGVEILGASSDHLVLDVTKARKDLKVGDILSFNLFYSAVLASMTSPYVSKEYIY